MNNQRKFPNILNGEKFSNTMTLNQNQRGTIKQIHTKNERNRQENNIQEMLNSFLGYVDYCGNFYLNLPKYYTENLEQLLNLTFFQKMSYNNKRINFQKEQFNIISIF